MARIRFIFRSILFGMCVLFSASAASAWELGLAGAFNWTHEWYSQLGSKGFFGPYNVDNGTGTRAANLNFWNGGQFDTNFTTSADAKWSYFNVELLPQVKINEALRFSGKYRLATYGDPAARDYHTQDAPGINEAFSDGQWTMFWASAVTPWGTLTVGKRPWTFGNALQYDGEDSCTTESIALVVPYGPMDFGIAFYPYRFAGSSSIPAYAGQDPYNLPPYVTTGGSLVPGQYFSRADGSGSFSKDLLAFMVYHSGAFQAGILGSYGSYHIGPEALLINPANPPAIPLVPLDSEFFHEQHSSSTTMGASS